MSKDKKAAGDTLEGRDLELLRRVYEVMVLTRAVDVARRRGLA